MKLSHCKLAICAALFLSVSSLVAQGPQPFSADYTTTISNGGEKSSGKMYFSAPKTRMDHTARGQSVTMIMDSATQVMYMVMPAQRMYMVMDAKARPLGGLSAPKPPTAFDPSHPCSADATCKKVGTETINGRVCDKWVTTDKNGTSTAWIDQKLLFPIKAMTSNGYVLELSNIKEGRPDPSVFEVPAGYRKMDMSGMIGGQKPH